MSLRRFMAVCLLVMGCGASAVQAGVVIGRTRVIYPSDAKEVVVTLQNQGEWPVLVQTWVDTGDASAAPDAIKVPFIIRPPLFRMDAASGHAVRLTYTGEPLPSNQETMYWFNVLEVPPKDANTGDENRVRFAFRSRIKLIFRPTGLQGNAAEAFKQLRWKWATAPDGVSPALEVTNPSPYYVNFAQLGLKVDGVRKLIDGSGMVAPGATTSFSLAPLKLTSRPAGEVVASFDVIGDSGEASEQEAPLLP